MFIMAHKPRGGLWDAGHYTTAGGWCPQIPENSDARRYVISPDIVQLMGQHGAHLGPRCAHVGPMNLAIWEYNVYDKTSANP